MSNVFGDAIAEFAELQQTLTKSGVEGTVISDEGYVTKDYNTDVEFSGVLLPRSRIDFTGAGVELRGEVFLYVSTAQEGWPELIIGDAVTDGDGTVWRIVSERNYVDTGHTRVFGLERDVK